MKENTDQKKTEAVEKMLHQYGEMWTESSAVDWEDLAQRFETRLSKQATRERRFSGLFGWRLQAGWAWSAAVVCVVALLLVPRYWNPSIGEMVFVSGEVLVNGVQANTKGLNSGNIVSPQKGGEAMISLDGGRIDLFLREGSRLALDSNDTVSLAKGDIWVRVDTNSGYFGIQTPHGKVQVHGTTFGVSVGDTETRVEIAAGEVSVETRKGTEYIRPGKGAVLKGNDSFPIVLASTGDVTPQWARKTFNQAATARELRYFPSVAPR